MLAQIALAALLVMATTAVHAGATAGALALVRRSHMVSSEVHSKRRAVLLVSTFVMMMFLAAVLDVGVWAGVYLLTGSLSDFETALYFSTTTFTTLGYGDIVLDPQWRLLASFEAMNGIILFGWTTALVVMLVQRVAGIFGAHPWEPTNVRS